MSDGDDARGTRPRQVTVGSVLSLVSCLLLIFSMLDAMGRMRSVEMRKSVEEVLSTPPGSGLGIEIETVIGLLRGAVLVTGGLAAAGAVLAVFTLQRHRGARTGLTVAAVLMLFTATFVSGLLPIVVAIGATMLWSRDARDWFSGRPAGSDRSGMPSPPETPVPTSPPASSTAWPPSSPPAGPPSSPPAWPSAQPDQPSAQQPAQQPVQQAPYQGGWPPAPQAAVPALLRRPLTVSIAAWLTWVFSAITLLFLLLLVVTLMADQDRLLEALQDNPQVAANGYSGQELLGFMWVIAAVGVFWCLSAIALAVLAYRRVNVARIALVVSAVFAGVLGVATLVGLFHAIAAFASVVLLFAGGANQWFAGEEPPGRWPGPPPTEAPSPGPTPGPAPGQGPGPKDKPPVW